jgi:hypothetical protein
MRPAMWIAAALTIFLSGPAWTENIPTGSLEPAARDDALAQLFLRVSEITLEDGRSVGTFLQGLPEEDVRLRRLLARQTRPLPPRRYRDGSIDLDLELDPRDLASALDQVRQVSPALQQRLARGSALAVQVDRISATGLAFPPAMSISLPVASQPSPTSGPADAAPPGWRHLDPLTRELTLRAARQQAVTNLFNDVRRVSIGPNHTIAALLRLAPERISAFRDALTEAAVFKVELDDAQVCAAHCDVPAEVAVDFLSPAVRREHLDRNGLSATGYSIPPDPFLTAGRDVPGWYSHTIAASGTSTGPDSTQSTLARTVALVDAKCRLAETIDALAWPAGGTVRERICASAGRADDLAVYLSGARPVRLREESGTVSVTLEIPLRRLYLLLSDYATAPAP